MDENKLEELENELRKLSEKYGIKNAVFAGEKEDRFIGILGIIPIESMAQLTDVICVTARLYQAGREKILFTIEKIANKR